MATHVQPRHYDLGAFKPKPRAIHGPTLVMDLLGSGWNRKHDNRPPGQATMVRSFTARRGTFLVIVYHVRNVRGPAWRVACTNEKGTTGLRSNCSPMTCHALANRADITVGKLTGDVLEFATQKLAMAWADAMKW
jgi:hypothetical protein